jgi:thiamine-phosphate pyrophosphorylase
MTRGQVGRLHIITDMVLQDNWTHADLAECAVAGGADVVQFREKRPLGTVALQEEAERIRRVLPDTVQLIINDYIEVALTAMAQGVHLGKRDDSPQEARRILGQRALIGATANSLHEARELFSAPVDYIGVGPVFGTRSKDNPAPAMGLPQLEMIASESPFPVIAIGGIQPRDVAAILRTGAHGIAVLSGAVCRADPLVAVQKYRSALEQALAESGLPLRQHEAPTEAE